MYKKSKLWLVAICNMQWLPMVNYGFHSIQVHIWRFLISPTISMTYKMLCQWKKYQIYSYNNWEYGKEKLSVTENTTKGIAINIYISIHYFYPCVYTFQGISHYNVPPLLGWTSFSLLSTLLTSHYLSTKIKQYEIQNYL